MNLRALLLALAGLGIPLALATIALPMTWGYAGSRGEAAFGSDYDYNDAQPLRLRRWQEPFELDDDAPDSSRALFVPMMLRGELLGFFCCGPKPDRTPYLADEVAALSLLADHAGLAFAWLGRAPVPQFSFGTTLQRD